MTVTYQVAGGGHLDIDFWVSWFSCLLSLQRKPALDVTLLSLAHESEWDTSA